MSYFLEVHQIHHESQDEYNVHSLILGKEGVHAVSYLNFVESQMVHNPTSEYHAYNHDCDVVHTQDHMLNIIYFFSPP